MLFDAAHDVERWDVRIRHGEIDLVHLRFGSLPDYETDSGGEADAPAPAGERFVLLAYRRDSRSEPVTRDYVPKDDDVVSAALHAPERDEALSLLAERGWSPIETSDEEAEAVAEGAELVEA